MAKTDLFFNEREQTGVEAGEGYVLEGNKATEAGVYTATASLVSGNYLWEDGSDADQTIPWAIYQLATTATLESSNCTYDGKGHAIGEAIVQGSTGPVTYHYFADEGLSCELASLPVNAGTYYVYAVVEPSGAYAGTTSNVVTLMVRKAANKITGATTFKKVGKVGEAVSFALKQSASAGTLTYSSSAPKYVSVSKSGKVTIAMNHTAKVAITVKASSTKNYGSASKTVYVYAKPGKMTLAKAINVRTQSIQTRWTKMIGADTYQVQRALNNTFSKGKKTYSVNGKTNAKKLTNLKKGKTYFVRLRAYDKQTASWSVWSKAKKVKVAK